MTNKSDEKKHDNNRHDNSRHDEKALFGKDNLAGDKVGNAVVTFANVLFYIYWAFFCGVAGVVSGFFTEIGIVTSGLIGAAIGIFYVFVDGHLARKYGDGIGAFVTIGLLIASLIFAVILAVIF